MHIYLTKNQKKAIDIAFENVFHHSAVCEDNQLGFAADTMEELFVKIEKAGMKTIYITQKEQKALDIALTDMCNRLAGGCEDEEELRFAERELLGLFRKMEQKKQGGKNNDLVGAATDSWRKNRNNQRPGNVPGRTGKRKREIRDDRKDRKTDDKQR